MNKYIVVESGNLWEEVLFDGDTLKAIKHTLETQDEYKTIVVRIYKNEIAYRTFITELFNSYLKIGRTWYYYNNYKLKKVDKITQVLLK